MAPQLSLPTHKPLYFLKIHKKPNPTWPPRGSAPMWLLCFCSDTGSAKIYLPTKLQFTFLLCF
ncbi:hypothetical protein LguiA_012764 [Lonicera macranthoides]